MENIDKLSGINVILSLFTGVTDKSDNEKKEKELSKQFGQLAERLLYGGYFSVNNKRIYLEEIEFYYHEEEGSLKDPAMYHTNAHQGKESLEYFVPGSLNCHVSGIDVTFENEEKKYRASFLIRGYRVERFNDGEWKVKEGKAFEKRSTYIYSRRGRLISIRILLIIYRWTVVVFMSNGLMRPCLRNMMSYRNGGEIFRRKNIMIPKKLLIIKSAEKSM